MPDLTPLLLPELLANRLNGLNTGADSVYPSYAHNSLVNLPASVCHWLDIPTFGKPAFDERILSTVGGPFQNVIVLLMDGLGLFQFQQFLNQAETGSSLQIWQELVQQGTLAPLTSVVPSTTSAALTTLWTGRSPAEHGILGYEMFLKEYGLIANTILHSAASFYGDVGGLKRAGFDPEKFLPVPTFGPHLRRNQVTPFALQHTSIARSGLSVMHMAEVNLLPFYTSGDGWLTLADLFSSRRNERTYAYYYFGDLDGLMHRYGPHDERIGLEFSAFSLGVAQFIKKTRKISRGNTLLLMLADHGQVHTPRDPRYELKYHPELLSALAMVPSGEARLAYFYIRPGREGFVRAYLQETWPDEFAVISMQQALDSNLFGSGDLHPALADRLGDLIVIALGSAYFWWVDRENNMLGRHGGLTPAEMLVPLLAVRI